MPNNPINGQITLIDLNSLELTGEVWETAGCSENAMALAHRCVLEEPTTVVMSKSSPRYRIQASVTFLIN